MKLQPILDELKDVINFKGRYEVQLEIPKTTTLKESEIEKILSLSSWKSFSKKEIDGFEGNRAVVIDRESPIRKGKIDLKGLQISGIGHRNFRILADKSPHYDDAFYPPSKENFMGHLTGTLMSTSHAEGNKIVDVRPDYRALGTYTSGELEEKMKNTMEVSKLQLEKMVVPHVEAYGRYLDSELRNEDGNFGFIVFPIPGSKKLRAGDEIAQRFFETVGTSSYVPILFYAITALPYVQKMTTALRELHENARRVHLQTHLNNMYLVDETPYVVDWATTRKLGNNIEENIVNRTIDIKRPADDFVKIFKNIFEPSHDSELDAETMAYESVMNTYISTPKKVNMRSLVRRTSDTFGEEGTMSDLIVQWMKDKGIEKHSLREIEQRSNRIGRNQPCYCGSGIKYKKCCGRNK